MTSLFWLMSTRTQGPQHTQHVPTLADDGQHLLELRDP